MTEFEAAAAQDAFERGATTPLKLTRLLNADGEVVGYFDDRAAISAARKEWDAHEEKFKNYKGPAGKCRSVETGIADSEIDLNIEPGDSDYTDYIAVMNREAVTMPGGAAGHAHVEAGMQAQRRLREWLRRGAACVEVSRWLINKYRRPGKSSRDADLGGPVEAAGVLYVLRVKAPR